MKGKKLTALLLASVLTVAAPVSAFAGSWQTNNTGWWYQNDDGSYPAGTWLNDGGTWYYFDGNGYMQTGWLNDGWNWYYLHGNGAMATGWIFDGASWYYLNSSGAMAANQWVGNYYVGSNGAMWTNAWTPDGYWVDASGTWIPGYQQATEGWVLDSNGWWYRNSDGSYPTNTWSMINGSWYYFDANGYMETCKWIGDYCVGIDGAMYIDTKTPDGYYVDEFGLWISSGEYVIQTVFWDDDEDCYHNGDQCGIGPQYEQKYKDHSGTILNAYAAGKFIECGLCFK